MKTDLYGLTYIGMLPMRWANMIEKKIETEVYVKTLSTMMNKAYKLQQFVVQYVYDGGEPFERNKDRWRQKKINSPRALYSTPLLATGAYVEAITVMKDTTVTLKNDNIARIFVGFKKEVHKHVKGLYPSTPYAELADILEYGSNDGTIPARPHWRPAWKKFQNVFRTRVFGSSR